MKNCAGNNQPQKQAFAHLVRRRWHSTSNKNVSIPEDYTSICIRRLQRQTNVILYTAIPTGNNWDSQANLSFSLFRLMGYRLTRELSGLTAEVTETQDSISTPILVPNIQYNHNLLERAAVLSALISEYLLWDTLCLVLFHNNWKNYVFTVIFKRLPPKLLF